MTSNNQTKSTPQFALLVFGKPTSADLPQASWFRAEDRATVIAAAQSFKFSVLDIQTDGDRSLLVGVHEGVLKGTGRMIVGSVTPEVYQRIEDYVAKASGALALKASNETGAGSNPAAEQTTNTGEKGKVAAAASDSKPEKPTTPPDPWAALRVGSHVVGKYWDDDGTPCGWWVGVITAIDKDDFMIRWPDEPKKPPLKIGRKHVAILHPDFDVKREWDRKR